MPHLEAVVFPGHRGHAPGARAVAVFETWLETIATLKRLGVEISHAGDARRSVGTVAVIFALARAHGIFEVETGEAFLPGIAITTFAR
jgi:hypothetical protein